LFFKLRLGFEDFESRQDSNRLFRLFVCLLEFPTAPRVQSASARISL